MMYRDEYYNRESYDKGTAEIIIGKQRQGETGVVPMRLFAEVCRFETMTYEAKAERCFVGEKTISRCAGRRIRSMTDIFESAAEMAEERAGILEFGPLLTRRSEKAWLA